MYNNAIPTYHRGERNYGTGYDMMKRIDELEAALRAVVDHSNDPGVVKLAEAALIEPEAKP
jgi:hypothetical protein